MKNISKKKLALFVFFAIFIMATFVRTYNFNDWLYFKMDQSRDALLMANAVENGPGYLPLLGARAGATTLKHGYLRLGPIFYYFQYASAVIFNSTQPYVYAYPDLFFSLAAIVLLYFFARLYFSRKHSLMIMAMYAFSFLIIQYSRFAWNPNSLQFFLLLGFYGLLRFLGEQKESRKKWWLALWATGIIIGSQLHFLGCFSLIGISGLLFIYHFQLWKKEAIVRYVKKSMLKNFAMYAGVVGLVVFIFYVPMVISEVKKGGQNSTNFIEALGSKPEKKPFQEKIVKDVSENLKYYCLITTSECYEGNIQKNIPAVLVTSLILLVGLILAIRELRKKGIGQNQKDFLMLIIMWFGVFSVLTIPFAFQLRPRFFIVVFAIPFIFLGLVYEYLEEKMKYKQALAVAILITLGVIGWNSHGTYAWFKEQAKSQKSNFTVERTLILKAKDGVTLGQLQGVADWMYARHKAGKTLYYYVKPEHVRPIEYLLYEKHDNDLIYETMKINKDPNAEYFAITPAKNGLDPVYKKFGNDIELVEQKQFGQLLVSEILVNNREISADFRFNKPKSKTDRIFWKDVFGTSDDSDKLKNITGDE